MNVAPRPDEIADAPLLDINDLTTVFPTIDGDVTAVRNVSFSVSRGEMVAVVGESGSGKSVTARSILRLVDYMGGELRGGAITLAGDNGPMDLATLDEAAIRKIRGNRISMVFQEPMTSLNPVLTIERQITEAIRLHQSVDARRARAIALDMLKLVRMPEAEKRLSQFPHELSGGMRQRVMIAMALACRPSLLIADEPTTALDVTIQAQILELVKTLRHEIGMAVIFITHDMGVVAEIADRVVVMYQGEKVEEGTAEAIFAAPQHAYTKALLSAIPRLGAMADKADPEPFDVIAYGDEAPPAPARVRPTHTNEARRTVLEVHNLVKRFPVRAGMFKRTVGHVHAVEGVDLTLKEGETLAIVGESGCGKSTVARTVMKLYDPTSGDIIIDGRNVTDLPTQLMLPVRRTIQMVFQDPYASLNPRMTVGDAVGEPLIVHDVPEARDKAARTALIAAQLERVGLPADAMRRYPHEFSGGQRQRICIARALVLNPKIIIADEAVSALDVSIQAQIVNLMMDLQAERGISYLFISHDMAVVERISHRVAVMYLGEIVEIGPRQAVFANPAHPYTQKLLSAVPVADPTARRERVLDQSEIPSPMRPVGFVPEKRPMKKVGRDHFVMA
ncbi:ABC transporter ATP-binding protein [Acuticoccus sp. MNP-M23]|uniref:ABC transporter ATP-binding protein n=1 Tax=Acuticoccus sp. MNP-M23 TaxID=3072793 RepID=UPI0028162BE1|nr:ABC transporter ATP-binding protein [Acuticoccus sp. MNP-M23]WMS41670.1 ABC transporter ATP-binding protein [Acuticoccus sp. MNP-M23]